MARLKALPSLDVIRGYKKVLDFYLWRGVPCVRRWPVTPRSRRTAASNAAAALFGQISRAYGLLSPVARGFLRAEAADQPRTARDLYLSGVLGHLHEATMTDFLTLLTECRDSLAKLEDLLNALDSVSTDELDVNVEASVLPVGAATQATLALCLATLQTIDDLANALQSIDTDRLIARGEDQLFSIDEPIAFVTTANLPGVDGIIETSPCPSGVYWAVTTMAGANTVRATTEHYFLLKKGADYLHLKMQQQAFGIWASSYWSGLTLLEPGHKLAMQFNGGQAGDSCKIFVTGYRITIEV